MDAKQDAWIAILVGMISSYALIFMYYRLHRYYPDLALTEYIEKLLKSARTHTGFSLRIIFCEWSRAGAARFRRDASYFCLS